MPRKIRGGRPSRPEPEQQQVLSLEPADPGPNPSSFLNFLIGRGGGHPRQGEGIGDASIPGAWPDAEVKFPVVPVQFASSS